jgi:ribosomal protein L7Ae-like RNA K-turn-binding protein
MPIHRPIAMAASALTALDEAARLGHLKRGMKMVLSILTCMAVTL